MKLRKRLECPNNNLFITALISLIVFLFLELGIRSFNLYKTVPFVDIPSHLFAGLAIFIGILWITSLTSVKRKKTVSLLFTFIAASIWEVLETLEELVTYNPPYLRDIFWWDGFWDVIVTVIGGLVAIGLLYWLKKKTKILAGIEI